MKKELNCFNCLHSQIIGDEVICVKKKFYDETVFKVQKPNESCPGHSSKLVEEFRYMRDNFFLQHADDACAVCGKLINTEWQKKCELVEVEMLGASAFQQQKDGFVDLSKYVCPHCKEEGRIGNGTN